MAYITLDKKIAKEYHTMATQTIEYPCDFGEMRILREELQSLCGISEIEAINVLTNRNVSLYISIYNFCNTTNDDLDVKGQSLPCYKMFALDEKV